MRIRVKQLGCQHSSESDYDTAVDIAHYYETRESIVLELPSGVRLNLENIEITKTRSYLEPDFDHFDATGQVVYGQHRDPNDEPETTKYLRVWLEFVGRLRALTLLDWQRAEVDPEEQHLDWMMADYAQELPWPRQPVRDEALLSAVNALGLRKGQSFNASALGPELEAWVQRVDELAWGVATDNLRARIDTRCEMAMMRLRKAIG